MALASHWSKLVEQLSETGNTRALTSLLRTEPSGMNHHSHSKQIRWYLENFCSDVSTSASPQSQTRRRGIGWRPFRRPLRKLCLTMKLQRRSGPTAPTGCVLTARPWTQTGPPSTCVWSSVRTVQVPVCLPVCVRYQILTWTPSKGTQYRPRDNCIARTEVPIQIAGSGTIYRQCSVDRQTRHQRRAKIRSDKQAGFSRSSYSTSETGKIKSN